MNKTGKVNPKFCLAYENDGEVAVLQPWSLAETSPNALIKVLPKLKIHSFVQLERRGVDVKPADFRRTYIFVEDAAAEKKRMLDALHITEEELGAAK